MAGIGFNTQGIRIFAPAKLNLMLEILGKRADGYHDLESLMISLELSDMIEVYPVENGETTICCRFTDHNEVNHSLRGVLESEQNLMFKAAKKLNEFAGVNKAARIILHKRIPSAAGLGGGSSDAAATLLALNQLWGLNLGKTELQKLGAELGSDIPYFLADSAWAICRGRGEIIEEIRSRGNLPVVVVKPNSGLSTPAVYRAAKIPEVKQTANELVQALQTGNISKWGKVVYNVLDEPGRQLNNELVKLRDILDLESGVVAQMTGSGSAYFVLCSHYIQALQLAQKLKGLGYEQTWATRTRSSILTCERIT